MDDLRDWLSEVQKLGELVTVAGADWDLEIGGVTMLSWSRTNRPALLFDRIPGYPEGYRVVTGSTSTPSRVALTFHLPAARSSPEVVASLRNRLNSWVARFKDFPPRVVKDGPVLQNVRDASQVNLLQFPIPRWHEGDGGRFIGTGDVVITRDPDSGEINLGTYRMQLFDEKTTGLFIIPGQHGRYHRDKYFARNQPCPVVVSIGHHPLLFRVAAMAVPAGAEMGVIGAIQGAPLEVITDEVTGLPFPAASEIVLAGFCRPGHVREEGPFGEWTGYYSGKSAPAPVFEVCRVYYRDDPILLGSPPGKPPNDSSYFTSVMRSAILRKFLSDAGVPDVRGVWVSEEANTQFIVVSLKQRYAGHAKQAGLLASQAVVGTNLGRYVVMVDEDIDPTNIPEVLWAICTRSDPEKDIDILRRVRTSPLDTMIKKPATAFFGSRAIIDACKPFEWKDEFPKEISISPEAVDRLRAKWPGL